MENQYYLSGQKDNDNSLEIENGEEVIVHNTEEAGITWDDVRKRNLLINIAKTLIKNGETAKKSFSREELVKRYKFKEYDLKYIIDSIFEMSGQNYCLKQDISDFIKKIIDYHFAVKPYLPSAEAKFLRIYGRYYDEFSQSYSINTSYDKMYESIKDVLPVLHWGYLPIFGRYLLYNRDIDPERNMLEFYDHIDCLNTLLREIRGETMELENRSDVSLNVDVDFRIYSRRYKKIENNTIRRTIDGWYFKSTSMEGNVQKDGSGIFTDYLKQENLFYPYDGVLYALENLWDDVDDGDVEYDEYVLRIGEIANWINETDQVIDQQPKWLQYKNGDVYHINEELSCAEGNKTLNKEMKFYVYTRRWGHEDCYRIKRTDTGWYCEFMTIDSNCGKDGKGGLQNNLNHDCIFYPKEGIEYAMLKLWDEANQGVLDMELLSERLQQVAEWISISEKSVYAQPDWVYYY